ncbi:MAG: NAD(P)H-binding protein [Solirubrobacteraceae bacterium]|nr:NAD(P)H-binding protein [Solirubrobacteraceae bacterium]
MTDPVPLHQASGSASRELEPVLVLGSTGTTGRRIVAGLRAEGVPVRAATRSPGKSAEPGLEPVRFDWDDPTSHEDALAGARAVYVLGPLVSTAPEAVLVPFIDRALALGVRRLVLLSGSPIRLGDPGLGRVHAHLAASGAEWAVLRPTWFAQNLLDPTHHIGAAVLAGDDLVTATGDGRVGFVDAADIAAVAVRALLDRTSHDTDHLITGPQALSYDEVAALLSKSTGHVIRHRAVSAVEAEEHMVDAGMPRSYAAVLAAMEVDIAAGSEAQLTDTVERVTGRAPTGLGDVLAASLEGRELAASATSASPTAVAR